MSRTVLLNAALYGAASQGAAVQGLTLTCTQTEADILVAQSDVSHESPFDAMTRLGLMMIKVEVTA